MKRLIFVAALALALVVVHLAAFVDPGGFDEDGQ